MFSSPNTAAIMSSVPANERGSSRACAPRSSTRARRFRSALLLADDCRAGETLPSAMKPDCRCRAYPRRWRMRCPICRRSAACSRRSSATTRLGSYSFRRGVATAECQRRGADRPEILSAPHHRAFHTGLVVVFGRSYGDDADRLDRVAVQPGSLRDRGVTFPWVSCVATRIFMTRALRTTTDMSIDSAHRACVTRALAAVPMIRSARPAPGRGRWAPCPCVPHARSRRG